MNFYYYVVSEITFSFLDSEIGERFIDVVKFSTGLKLKDPIHKIEQIDEIEQLIKSKLDSKETKLVAENVLDLNIEKITILNWILLRSEQIIN